MVSRLGKWSSHNTKNIQCRRPPKVKSSKVEIMSRDKIPEIRFGDQRLISFRGLVVFKDLFKQLAIKQKLQNRFSHLKVSPIFGHHFIAIALCVIVHLLLGYRKLVLSVVFNSVNSLFNLPLARVKLSRFPGITKFFRRS